MKPVVKFVFLSVFVLIFAACGSSNKVAESNGGDISKSSAEQYPEIFKWPVHDMNRPVPTAITPGTFSTPEQPGKAPSDAIVLFDGQNLEKWRGDKGDAAAWTVRDGYVEVAPKSGNIWTKESFGDIQLHAEWAAPVPPTGTSQGRGNSGIKIMGLYEIQVLDSYDNRTYADGQAGAVYGQYPPLVNAAMEPGKWQVYDIIFHRPHFDEKGNVTEPAYATVFLNGVLVQYHVRLSGPTGQARAAYKAHDKAPIMLQNHSNPVRYRNIWVRPLE